MKHCVLPLFPIFLLIPTYNYLLNKDPSDVRIKITPNRQGVSHIGQDLEILCEILGTSIYQNPMWKGPSGQLVPGATAERNNLRVQEVYETPSATRLYISGLSPADKGQYICMVGPVMARFTLMVTGKSYHAYGKSTCTRLF